MSLEGKERILENANEAADYLNKEANNLFPKGKFKAYVSTSLGTSLIIVAAPNFYTDAMPNNIPENDPSHMKFMMHLSDNRGKALESISKVSLEALTMHYTLRERGVKYRKISGKTPMDVAKKFVKWIEKNKDGIIVSE